MKTWVIVCSVLLGACAGAAKNAKSPAANAAAEGALKPWDDVLKDSTKADGFIPVHVKKDQTVYFELAPAALDRDFGMTLHISRGLGDLGMIDGLSMSDGMLVRFQRVGNKIYVELRNSRFTAREGTPMHASLADNQGHSLLGVLPIVSEHDKSKAVLADAGKFLASDWMKLSAALQPHYGERAQNPVTHDGERSYVERALSFPRNTEIDVTLTYVAALPPADGVGAGVSNPFAVPVGLRYSLFALPEQPMRPRLADDRLGFFTTPKFDFSRERGETGLIEFVNRWRLEKKQPDAAVSEPVTPIVFYLDRSVPEEYRESVRAGVLAWNPAFEQAGFRNAIVVKDAPDDPSWHAEDIRYSTIRWSAAYNMGFAIGPSQADPRTGELLNADILIWSEFVRGWERDYQMYGQTPPAALPGMRTATSLCAAATGLANELAFQQVVLSALGIVEGGEPLPAEVLDAGIRELVLHEVGHTIGLRHNFKSSTAVPADKLHDRSYTDVHGITASVMDYAPVNLAADPSRQGAYYTTVAGPYDVWAIQYGYSVVPGADGKPATSTEDELPALAQIAARAAEPQLSYSTDEDSLARGFGIDPRSNVWDLGDDPLTYVEQHVALVDAALPKLEQRLLTDGEPFTRLRSAFLRLLQTRYRSLTNAAKTVGGVASHRDHKGDPNARTPLAPVAAAEQRRAVDLILARGFAAGALPLSASTLNQLAPTRTQGFDWVVAFDKPTPIDVPIHQWVTALQGALLDELLAPPRLARIVDNAVRAQDGAPPFQLEELFTRLTDGLWSEVFARGAVSVDSYRRNSQRAYLERLIDLMLTDGIPEDARSLARFELGRIEKAAADARSANKTTAAHLEESAARARRAREASLTLPKQAPAPKP